tara:strand:+ start:2176 stop:2787 length:612 start_codon:yes stop_codon:yes gene_type:complete
MPLIIEQARTSSGIHLTMDTNGQLATRCELLLRETEWPGTDIQALANAVASTWPSSLTPHEDRHRLSPGESRQGRRGCVGRVLDGLRADLFFERKIRSGEWRTYCYPIFFVDRELGGSNRQFRIGPLCSFALAYSRAVAHYAKQRQLSHHDTVQALCRVPPRGLFFGIIEHRQSQGYPLCAERIKAKLGFTSETIDMQMEDAA